MIAIREGALVVAPPGGSVSFTPDQLEQAEQYGRAIDFGVEMLRRQAAQAARDRQQRARRERGGS